MIPICKLTVYAQSVSQSNSVRLKVMVIGPKQYKMQNNMNKTDFYVTPERIKTGHHYGNCHF